MKVESGNVGKPKKDFHFFPTKNASIVEEELPKRQSEEQQNSQ